MGGTDTVRLTTCNNKKNDLITFLPTHFRILSDSELAREQLVGLEQQIEWSLKIIGNPNFANQTEEDQTRIKKEFAELEKQRDEAIKQHEETKVKLFKTGSWPAGPSTAVEDGVEEKHKEVVKYIQELKDTSLQMRKILGEISMFKSPPPPPLFLEDDSDGAPMDVNQPDDWNAPRESLKRKRLLDGQSAPPMPTREELDGLLERLAHMEGLIFTLQNDINEHSQEAREEFEQFVDTKFDEFQAAREEAERQRLEEERRLMQALDQDITVTGEQVGELASEIGDLIARVDKLEVDVGASRKGRQESMEKVLEVGFFPLLCELLFHRLIYSIFLCLFIGGKTFTRIHLDTRCQRWSHPNFGKCFERLHLQTSLSTRISTKLTTFRLHLSKFRRTHDSICPLTPRSSR